MRRIFTALALLATAAPAWADDVCPAPINSGTWDAWVNGVGTGKVSTLNWVQSQPASARGQAQIDAAACDGTFILQMPSLTFPMAPSGSATAGGPQSYEGSTSANGFNWVIELTLLSDSELAGGFSATMGAGDITTDVNVSGMGLRYPENLAAQPAACYCRTRLEAFIDKELDSARRYRDHYADPANRVRPADWPPDNYLDIRRWRTSTYKRVIELMVRGYSHDQATQRVLANSYESGDQKPDIEDYDPPQTGTASGDTGSAGIAGSSDEEAVEYYSVQAASVDRDCNLQVGDTHLDSCYPDIALQSTLIHENVHVTECKASVPISGVDAYADSEVRAYDAEIDWLESWISDNCG